MSTRQVAEVLSRNLVINGNFDTWQRQVSFTISNTNAYTADRWRHFVDSAHTSTVTRSTDVPTLAQAGAQSAFSYLVTNGTGAAAIASTVTQLQYRMEGLDYAQLHGRKCRLQFWVKSSITGAYSIGLCNAAGDRRYFLSYSIVAANTWELKTFDLTADTTGTWLFDNQAGLLVLFNISLGSTLQGGTANSWQGTAGGANGLAGTVDWSATTGATFQITQVMLTPGDFTGSTTPFQRCTRTVAEELMICQRYFEKSYALGTFAGALTQNGPWQGGLASDNTGILYGGWSFKATKRTTPTLTFYTYTSGTGGQLTRSVAGGALTDVAATGFSSQSCVTFQAGGAVTAGQTAQVLFHWTAESEL